MYLLSVSNQLEECQNEKSVLKAATHLILLFLWWAQLQHTAMYRAASRLYPVISNYADPALDKITGSAYYSAVVDHLKPLPSGAPHDPSVSSGESKAFHILSCAPC